MNNVFYTEFFTTERSEGSSIWNIDVASRSVTAGRPAVRIVNTDISEITRARKLKFDKYSVCNNKFMLLTF